MSTTVDYCFTPVSPWAYLGHARFVQILKDTGAAVNVRPVDYGAIFPVSGGLPLPKRAPQRQAYRLVELQRFSTHLGLPLNLKPAFFPVSGDAASKLIVAADLACGAMAALDLAGRMGRAVWAEERNLADPDVLQALLAEVGLPAALMADSARPEVAAACAGYTEQAIEAGVFGAPSYVIDGEIFWGQDRLDFVERRLRAG
jgi:2-hydroxychromene-2-carboxylate isomerase